MEETVIGELVSRFSRALGRDPSSLGELLNVAADIGMQKEALERDLRAVLQERMFTWLVGDPVARANFLERKDSIARRLGSLSPACQAALDRDAVLVDRLARIQNLVAEYGVSAREGAHSLEERMWTDLLKTQGNRCRVCGVPFRHSVVRQTRRFSEGTEPVGTAHLDHVLPYYLLGNSGGFAVLCAWCNTLKNDRLGVQEDGLVLCGNHHNKRKREAVPRRMAFWTLVRDRRCGEGACARDSRESLMYVQRRLDHSPYVYGNLTVRCEEHAAGGAVWLHFESYAA